ncbi:MAG: DUF4026 domain-containing protein [Polyangiales bacterium]
MLEVPVTTLRALLPSGAAPGVSAVASRLRDAGLQLSPDVGASCRWCLRGELPRGEGMPGLAVAVTLRPCRGLPPHSEGLGAEEAAAADFELDVEARLGVDPLADYHALLRVTAAVAPDLVLMVDEGSSAVRFPEWVHETAETAAPPSPRVLYTVHAVRRNGRAWVHTHGLVRAGAIELEMLDVPEEALSCLAPLVHAVAAQWLEQGPPCPGEKFEAGRDLELAWAPWPKAIAKVPPVGAGGSDDRDDVHAQPAGVLFVPVKGLARTHWRCPSSLAPVLQNDPLLYVSQMETERMAALAKERWGLFAQCLARHVDEPDYRFLVKLGYEGEGEHVGQREHLWAEVHEARDHVLEATVACRPRLVSLAQGERGEHEVARVTDWLVVTPHGNVGPDDAVALEED